MQDGLRRTELGQQAGAAETRIEWEGSGRSNPVMYMREMRLSILAEFLGPEDFLENAWNDITACALVAGGIAGLPAIAASPPKTLPVFEEAFYACLSSIWPQEARQLRVGLITQLRPNGDWQMDGYQRAPESTFLEAKAYR